MQQDFSPPQQQRSNALSEMSTADDFTLVPPLSFGQSGQNGFLFGNQNQVNPTQASTNCNNGNATMYRTLGVTNVNTVTQFPTKAKLTPEINHNSVANLQIIQQQIQQQQQQQFEMSQAASQSQLTNNVDMGQNLDMSLFTSDMSDMNQLLFEQDTNFDDKTGGGDDSFQSFMFDQFPLV
jgi:two-component sensor histidine kinase